ncbi:MAG TPA: hypothetical protein VN408_42280 [Actinoplanes sp.]|nr:hypothetical protein [Actinoplanes sp.]
MYRTGPYLVVFLLTASLNVVVATTWVRPDLAIVVGTLLWTVPMVVLYATSPWPYVNARVVCLMVAWLFSAVLMGLVVMGFWALVLQQRGERADTLVTAVHGSPARDTVTYSLAYRGEPVPGRLINGPDGLVPGKRVVVILDPRGLVDPRMPAEVADAEGMPVLIGVTVVLMAGLCAGAARARKTELA